MLSSLLWKLGKPLGLHAATRAIRDAAEGKGDPRLTRIYWALAGKKVWTGLFLKLTAAVLFGLGYIEAAGYTVAAGLFLVGVGLVDKAWRTEIPAEVLNSALFQFLSRFKAELTTILASATAYYLSAECSGPYCDTLARVCMVLTLVALEFGLITAAAKAPAPLVDRDVMAAAQVARLEKAAQEGKPEPNVLYPGEILKIEAKAAAERQSIEGRAGGGDAFKA